MFPSITYTNVGPKIIFYLSGVALIPLILRVATLLRRRQINRGIAVSTHP